MQIKSNNPNFNSGPNIGGRSKMVKKKINTSELNDILNNKYAIISVMGPHAGDSNEQIFSREIQDITNTGLTY
jgi:hypothetical protein